MRYYLILFTMLFCVSAYAQDTPPPPPLPPAGLHHLNCDSPSTQSDLDKCAMRDFIDADMQLKRIYSKILVQYKGDTAFVSNMKAAHQLWLQLREADMKMRYPASQTDTKMLMCSRQFVTRLTNDRIKYLQLWLDGIEEVNVCIGSVKMKQEK